LLKTELPELSPHVIHPDSADNYTLVHREKRKRRRSDYIDLRDDGDGDDDSANEVEIQLTSQVGAYIPNLDSYQCFLSDG